MALSTKSVLAVLAGLMLIPMLGGCETTQSGRGSSLATPPGSEPVTVAARMPDQVYSDAGSNGVINGALSNSSVTVYNLDGQSNDTGAPVAQVTEDPYGMPMANDPRVTVYPVDGGGYPQGFYGQQPQGYANALPDRPGVASIYFEHGSARIGGNDRQILNSAAEAAKFAPVERVSVEGHASSPAQTSDPVRAKILNLKESMNRAAAVSQSLIERGVPAEKIKTVGWGDTKMTGGGDAAERRVDVITAPGAGF